MPPGDETGCTGGDPYLDQQWRWRGAKNLWLTGPAGSGKTAIAGCIAEACEDEAILAGSFFFSSFAGSEARGMKRNLIATLVYCLLQHDALQPLSEPIFSAIERDPTLRLFRRSLSAQAKALLLWPFQYLSRQLALASLPKVFVVDGLDEVEAPKSREMEKYEARLANEAEQVDILSTLLLLANSAHFPFRIVIVSRPEPAIRGFFSREAVDSAREIFLDGKYDPDSDILLFLNAKFADLRRRYKLPVSWPGREVLDALRDSASGQFIYAATVIRYLRTSKKSPQGRLESILKTRYEHPPGGDAVFSPLDALYTNILMSGPDPVSSVRLVGALRQLHNSPLPPSFVRLLLEEEHGQVDYLLENLVSLLSIPPPEDDSSPFEMYHKSFLDYLNDPARCGRELWEAFRDGLHGVIGRRCVQIFKAKSPISTLADFQWQAFIRRYLGLWYLFWPPQFQLPECDVCWWVQTLDATFSDLPEKAGHGMGALFSTAHAHCDRGKGLIGCTQLCKRWRGDIFTACQALGWRVPNSTILLLERMFYEAGAPSSYWPRFQDFFEPPRSASRFVRSRPSRGEESTYRVLSEEDYGRVCAVAASMYDRLPADWRKRYDEQLSAARPGSNALRLDIG
ncbi:hypothetical protein NMY22_g1185 [Coprinellus aureogranulatus]|nr:hypothetical protein NMY22_g1185 [Coprinellus aureogranulatus]